MCSARQAAFVCARARARERGGQRRGKGENEREKSTEREREKEGRGSRWARLTCAADVPSRTHACGH
eukprot:5708938-Pleurochrysis_carterae.AAC.1